MKDTRESYYGIVLETQRRKDMDDPQESISSHQLKVLKVLTSWSLGRGHQGDADFLFMDDKKWDLCSYKAVRKVHKVNKHKRKEQLVSAY